MGGRHSPGSHLLRQDLTVAPPQLLLYLTSSAGSRIQSSIRTPSMMRTSKVASKMDVTGLRRSRNTFERTDTTTQLWTAPRYSFEMWTCGGETRACAPNTTTLSPAEKDKQMLRGDATTGRRGVYPLGYGTRPKKRRERNSAPEYERCWLLHTRLQTARHYGGHTTHYYCTRPKDEKNLLKFTTNFFPLT